jgi:hypothetical protein
MRLLAYLTVGTTLFRNRWPPEPGLDGHQQEHVDLSEQILVWFEGGAGAERDAGAGVHAPQVPGQLFGGLRGFHVEGDRVGAGVDISRGPPFRVFDHQMAVERDGGGFRQGLDD